MNKTIYITLFLLQIGFFGLTQQPVEVKDSIVEIVQIAPPPIVKAPKINLEMKPSVENDSLAFVFGNEIRDIIYNQELESFQKKFLTRGYKAKLEKGVELTNNDQEMLAKGYYSNIVKNIDTKLESILHEWKWEYIDFVHYRFDYLEGTYFVLLRLFDGVKGLNYIDLQLNKTNDQWYFVDIYNYYSGSFMSEGTNLILQQLLFNGLGNKNLKVKDIEALSVMVQFYTLFHSNQYEKAYAYLKENNETIKHNRGIQILACIAASNISEEMYEESLISLMNNFPNDAKISLLILDYYTFTEQYDKATTAIDILQEETGDFFLEYLRANLKYMDKKYEEADKLYATVTHEYPLFLEAFLNWNELLIEREEYAKVTENFNTMMENSFIKKEIIKYYETKDSDKNYVYKDLVQSEFYQNWKKKK